MEENKEDNVSHTLDEIIKNHEELDKALQKLGDLIKALNPSNKKNDEVSE